MSEPSVKVGDLGEAPVIPIVLILAGAYLAWFGIHYWRRDIEWPSDPVKSVLQGKGLPSRGQVTTSAAILTSVQSATGQISVGPGGGPAGIPLLPGHTSGDVTPEQVYKAFRAEGIPRRDAIYLTAIAGVESGYSTHAFNGDAATGDYSIGLTQINYFGSLYEARTKLIGMTPQQLLNSGLQGQARATAILYRESGLQPWEPDITSGKINQYMPGAMAAASQAGY